MKEIDVEQIIRGRVSALAAWLPSGVMRRLARLLRQDEVNHILGCCCGDTPLHFIKSTLAYMDIDHRATGFDALRPDGRYLFVANHPFGGLDGLMLAAEVCERMGDVRVVANDLLMNIEPLRPIFLPVNKHGGQSGRVVEMCCRIFESDIPVVTFPAGLCSRRVAGRVVDLEWKSHFIKRAVMSRRDVVPVFFEGRLSDRFYRVAEWRRRLGVRSNVEMLLLVDEMFRQRGGRFEIRVGQPLAWQTLRERRTLHRMVELVRSQVYSMWRT